MELGAGIQRDINLRRRTGGGLWGIPTFPKLGLRLFGPSEGAFRDPRETTRV